MPSFGSKFTSSPTVAPARIANPTRRELFIFARKRGDLDELAARAGRDAPNARAFDPEADANEPRERVGLWRRLRARFSDR
jgi:hypothetical protein